MPYQQLAAVVTDFDLVKILLLKFKKTFLLERKKKEIKTISSFNCVFKKKKKSFLICSQE